MAGRRARSLVSDRTTNYNSGKKDTLQKEEDFTHLDLVIRPRLFDLFQCNSVISPIFLFLTENYIKTS